MWTPQSKGVSAWSGGNITLSDVLYYFDGPLLFTSKLGLNDFLFYKVEDSDELNLFLVVQTNDQIIGALKNGSLSLRGAMASDAYWLFDLGAAFVVRKYWEVGPADLPEEFLPVNGVGILANKGPVPDTIEQAISFFSVKFVGEELDSHRAMGFSVFKTIMDNAYEALRKIFPAPVVDQRVIRRNFDFALLPPRFASLLIAVTRPMVDLERMKKETREKVDLGVVQKKADEQRKKFFDSMTEIIGEAAKGELKADFAIEHFITLDQVKEIVPTETNRLDVVEFRAEGTTVEAVRLDDTLGGRIRNAHRLAEKSKRQITGVVVEINDASGTLVIRDDNYRQTTCVFERETFDGLKARIGYEIAVRGKFVERIKRDKIFADSAKIVRTSRSA